MGAATPANAINIAALWAGTGVLARAQKMQISGAECPQWVEAVL
jgi:hypothetical protein